MELIDQMERVFRAVQEDSRDWFAISNRYQAMMRTASKKDAATVKLLSAAVNFAVNPDGGLSSQEEARRNLEVAALDYVRALAEEMMPNRPAQALASQPPKNYEPPDPPFQGRVRYGAPL